MNVPNADVHTLAAAYVLHAIPATEIAEFESHLGECEACREEVAELRETAARLGAAAALAPPAHLRLEVMSRIREVRPLPPLPPQRDRRRVTTLRRGRKWWPPVSGLLVAALAVGAIVLGARLDETSDQLDRAQAATAEIRGILAAPDLEIVQAEAGNADVTLAIAGSADAVLLLANGMDPPPADHAYQVWFMGDGETRSAGLLGGDEQVEPFVAYGLGAASEVGVTIEPASGSLQPTTDPIMVIGLPG